ncbi:uncharacterized protein RJT21DRAFT_26345 [Scheffersomyces amazonensis]|uniref:uncharacterized protein n=1 Tax=Scheffersomyces amazonensis TaxID=1078765 RepID=UPI00315D1701
MDVSCGPSNALTNLSKHTQRDNSLQNEFALRNNQQSRNHPGNFKTNNGVDHRLNQEFQQFNGGNDFANSFMTQFQPVQHRQQPVNPMQVNNPAWVSDFSNLSISQQPQPVQQSQANNLQGRSDWHQQFMQQSNNQMQIPSSQQQQQQPQFVPNYAQGMGMGMGMAMTNGPIFSQHQQLQQPLQGQATEHQEVHKMEQEHKHFENQFDMIEKELQDQELQQDEQVADQTGLVDDSDKERFAETARKVETSMQNAKSSQETKSKFQNSDFLKLMSSISTRQVELSGDKLVKTTNGEDIRQYLSDPLQDVRGEDGRREQTHGFNEEINYHAIQHGVPAFPQQSVAGESIQHQQNMRPDVNHLPDPLAHIKDGDLGDIMDPFTAARVITGGQVNLGDWTEDLEDGDDDMMFGNSFTGSRHNAPRQQKPHSIMTDKHQQEVYDDYRHDDDFH